MSIWSTNAIAASAAHRSTRAEIVASFERRSSAARAVTAALTCATGASFVGAGSGRTYALGNRNDGDGEGTPGATPTRGAGLTPGYGDAGAGCGSDCAGGAIAPVNGGTGAGGMGVPGNVGGCVTPGTSTPGI